MAEREWKPLSEAPRERGKDIRIRMPAVELNAFWDDELGVFVLNRNFHIELVSPLSRGCEYLVRTDTKE